MDGKTGNEGKRGGSTAVRGTVNQCFISFLDSISRMLTAPFCKWFWSGLNGYLNTEPNRVFGALGY